MSIRLSKACKDLNVGMSTAVEFLAKKGHKIAVDPNSKITDEEHLLLAKEFNKDMALKLESERLSQERQAKEKADDTVALEGYEKKKPEIKEELIKTTVSNDYRPHIKEVGHIDLENKPKQTEKEQPKPVEVVKPTIVTPEPEKAEKTIEVTAPEIKKEEKIEIPEPVKEVEKPVVEIKQEPETEKTIEPVVEKTIEPVAEKRVIEIKKNQVQNKPEEIQPNKEITPKPVSEIKEEENLIEEVTEEIYRIGKPKLTIKPVVIGTIDLDTLNQSTRPKSKTKEQKKKEREERNKAFIESKTKKVEADKDGKTPLKVDLKPGKRKRINTQRVDINKPDNLEFNKKQ